MPQFQLFSQPFHIIRVNFTRIIYHRNMIFMFIYSLSRVSSIQRGGGRKQTKTKVNINNENRLFSKFSSYLPMRCVHSFFFSFPRWNKCDAHIATLWFFDCLQVTSTLIVSCELLARFLLLNNFRRKDSHVYNIHIYSLYFIWPKTLREDQSWNLQKNLLYAQFTFNSLRTLGDKICRLMWAMRRCSFFYKVRSRWQLVLW